MLAEAIGGPCPEPVAVAVTSWATDPYASGAYTHIPPGASPAMFNSRRVSRSADVCCSRESTPKAPGWPTPTAR